MRKLSTLLHGVALSTGIVVVSAATSIAGAAPAAVTSGTIKLGGGMEAIPNAGTGSYQICLYNAQTECVTAQGAGNQMVLGSPGSNFNVDENGYNYQFDTNGGNLCLREKNDHSVVGSTNGCSWSDSAEVWNQETGVSWLVLTNQAHTSDELCAFGTSGNLNGKPIWADPPGQTNQWTKWKL